MSLRPLTRADEIADTLSALELALTQGSQPLKRTIGYRGGSGEHTVYWHPHHRFWAAVHPYYDNRHSCVYGTMDPTRETHLSSVCEINPPVKGFDRRCAGVFLRDAEGRIYLGHSGKIGGGRPGIGKRAFTQFARDANWRSVTWPDGETTRVIVIGRIDDVDLASRVAAFVRTVEEFKHAATSS